MADSGALVIKMSQRARSFSDLESWRRLVLASLFMRLIFLLRSGSESLIHTNRQGNFISLPIRVLISNDAARVFKNLNGSIFRTTPCSFLR